MNPRQPPGKAGFLVVLTLVVAIAIAFLMGGCSVVPSMPTTPPADDPIPGEENAPPPVPVPLPQAGELPANVTKIAIDLGSGSTVIDNVRTTDTERTVVITRNSQDLVIITNPPLMTSGIKVDKTTLPPLTAGYAEQRVKDTDQEPLPPGGSFRTICDVAWVDEHDMIVYPGQQGRSHTHTGFGNKGANAFSTTASLLSTGSTACRGGTVNKSSYWIPTMIDTRTAKPILPTGTVNIYYKNFSFDRHTINEFPVGLRMITGDPNSTTPQPNNTSRSSTWKCRDTFFLGIPIDQALCPPGSELIHGVIFPNCWDGQNLDSPDHKSHMKFGANIKVPGSNPAVYKMTCPTTHPKVIAQLSFLITYTVTDTRYMRLVSDTNTAQPAGWTSHGDVSSAWVEKFMKMWVNNCLRAGAECFSHLLGRDPDDGKLKAIY